MAKEFQTITSIQFIKMQQYQSITFVIFAKKISYKIGYESKRELCIS